MSADTLIELTAILIAVYAILPRARRLEVRIQLRLLSAVIFTIGLLIIVQTFIHEQKMGVKLGDTFWGMCTLMNPLDWSQNSTAILQAASRVDLSN